MKMVWTIRSSGLDDICGEESVRWTWCSTEFGIDIWSPTIAASCQLLHHFFPGEHANGNRGSPWNGSVKDLVGLRARFNGICVAWRIREMCLSDKTWQPGLLLVIHGSLRKMPIWMYSFEHASTLLSWRYIDVDICESIGLDIGSVGLCILCFIRDTEVCFSCASFISKRDMSYTIRPLCSLTQWVRVLQNFNYTLVQLPKISAGTSRLSNQNSHSKDVVITTF